jgi:hypothetical protein
VVAVGRDLAIAQDEDGDEGLIDLEPSALTATGRAPTNQDRVAEILERQRLGPKRVKALEELLDEKRLSASRP